MGVYGKIQLSALALLLVAAAAGADPSALHNYSPDGTPDWANNPAYMECGLKCIYLESVEKISIRSRHTLETINQMRAITATDSVDDTKADVKMAQAQMDQIIPGMCDWGGHNGPPESVKACQIRWFKVQLPTLYQDRMAIKFNTDSAATLENGQVPAITVNGTVTVDTTKSPTPPKGGFFLNAAPSDYEAKTPVVTSMEQYNDIRARALQAAGRDPRLIQITALTQEIEKTTSVSHDEFVKTREILKDPSDPKAGTYTIVETNKDGTTKYDEAAYNKEVTKRKALLDLTPEEKKRLEANLSHLTKLHQDQLGKANVTHEKIYTAVRKSILGAARGALRKFNVIGGSSSKTPTLSTAKGAKPAAPPLIRAAATARGSATDNVTRAPGSDGDDKDIVVPATPQAGARPFFTVGYSDNVLGDEIKSIEQDLAQKRGITIEP